MLLCFYLTRNGWICFGCLSHRRDNAPGFNNASHNGAENNRCPNDNASRGNDEADIHLLRVMRRYHHSNLRPENNNGTRLIKRIVIRPV